MEDNVSWLPHSNDCFCIWKHRLNHVWVTDALHRPKKPPNMVLYQGKFSQPYSQCPFWARAYVRSRLSLVLCLFFKAELKHFNVAIMCATFFVTWQMFSHQKCKIILLFRVSHEITGLSEPLFPVYFFTAPQKKDPLTNNSFSFNPGL